MAHRTAVINLVALGPAQLACMPRLRGLMQQGTSMRLAPPLPAVTCTSQATMLTGAQATVHGIVGNGWHDRCTAETRFWQQSSRLVQAPRVWDELARNDPAISCANCFWWHAMYASTDVTVTPRPMYRADGRKIPDIWTQPTELRHAVQSKLGQFPLFKFWGPGADITSSRWIAQATAHVEQRFDPTLLLCYLPHLDYGLQKYGPDDPRMVHECELIDEVAADLIGKMMDRGRRVLVVNEYGIMPVTGSVAPNLALREAGALSLRVEQGREYLDAGASRAFVVPDHQIAHVYLRNQADAGRFTDRLMALDGVDRVLDDRGRRVAGLDHDRAGDLILVARQDRWFRHDWWTDPAAAPDWQRTVDIHRKPGYDPRELFLDPSITFPKLKIGGRLLAKKLGLRTLMDVIPLDDSLVKGSHGRPDPEYDPILWSSTELPNATPRVQATAVRSLIEQLVLEDVPLSAKEA
ncbi:MAG: alkaline phosphatase family protein [Phycisphaerales bacterium]|nr:alkaline phosphatase family protein [Phycisphaerales bacterium]